MEWRHTAHNCPCHDLIRNGSSIPKMSPSSVGVRACVRVWDGYYVFLACSLLDNLITTFSSTLTHRSKTAIGNKAHFWQGGGLWDVYVRDFFLFLSLLCVSVFHFQLYGQLFILLLPLRRMGAGDWQWRGDEVRLAKNKRQRLSLIDFEWVSAFVVQSMWADGLISSQDCV